MNHFAIAPAELPAFAIANETAADVAARDRLLDRAMGPRWRRKSSEKLRRGRRPSEGLAFVARDEEGRVAGTVRLWDVRLGDGGGNALLLGPLAVDPSVKSAGLGSALMRHAIAEAARLGHGAVLLVGDPAYYARFGFEHDPHLSHAGAPSWAFQCLTLNGPRPRGEVSFHPAFESRASGPGR